MFLNNFGIVISDEMKRGRAFRLFAILRERKNLYLFFFKVNKDAAAIPRPSTSDFTFCYIDSNRTTG